MNHVHLQELQNYNEIAILRDCNTMRDCNKMLLFSRISLLLTHQIKFLHKKTNSSSHKQYLGGKVKQELRGMSY